MIQTIRSSARMLLLAGLLIGSSAAVPAVPSDIDEFSPPEGRLTYTVLRHGDKIGTQTVEFRRQGDDRLTVRYRVDISVDLLFVTLYRFHHESEERWVGDRLVALTSRTDDDGDDRKVELHSDGERLRGTYNSKKRNLAADLLPASFWSPEMARQSILLDPIKGKTRSITVTDRGEETIELAGEEVRAHRYDVDGEIERNLWYGPDGRLLRMQFTAKDGSRITVILRDSMAVG